MNLRIHQNRYSILIFICVVCTFYAVNAQDTKPIIKPKPSTAPKPVVVKPQPKPITTQTENKSCEYNLTTSMQQQSSYIN